MTAQSRKTKVAANVRAYYSRADYVIPKVALDAAHSRALRSYMKREGLGVSDAIRAAVMLAAAAGKPAPKRKPAGSARRAAKSHQGIQS